MTSKPDIPLVNRELSWLYFNARVLQEAENPAVPLYERLKYLSIFSSNLDEFFAVRVAALQSVLRLDDPAKGLEEDPAVVLADIRDTVHAQQERFGAVFRESVLPALEAVGVPLLREHQLDDASRSCLRAHFETNVHPHLRPTILEAGDPLFLEHQALYLACELWPGDASASLPETGGEPRYGFVEVPADKLGRFVTLDSTQTRRVLFLDDVVRLYLTILFPGYRPGEAYSIKVSRDAELYLDTARDDLLREEFPSSFRKQLRRSLDKRGEGLPTHLLFDPETPAPLLDMVRERLGLASADLVPGGRYHHLRDLSDYPPPVGAVRALNFPPQPPHPHPVLADANSIFKAVGARDQLLLLPYQRFDPVLAWVNEAATDPHVVSIAVTIYRVASDSAVAAALAEAARNGKQVRAVIELKARFDEANNLDIAETLEKAGVRVFYTPRDLKVHAKLMLFERREAEAGGTGLRRYAYLGTGNLNESTAHLYTDFGLFTADTRLADEVSAVFAEVCDEAEEPGYEQLLVAPRTLRRALYRYIDAEAKRARRGEEAWLFFKMNSLEDEKMIRRLYRASQAGVHIRLLVRGICRLVPGLPGVSDNIEARAIVGRYLEHGRAYVFNNGGSQRVFLGSADLMRRNLSGRVEVLFPILDGVLAHEVQAHLAVEWADTLKARYIDGLGSNLFVQPAAGAQPCSSQDALYARYAPAPAERTADAARVPVLLNGGAGATRAAPRHAEPSAALDANTASVRNRLTLLAQRYPIPSITLFILLVLLVPFALFCNSEAPPPTEHAAVSVSDTTQASYLPLQPDAVLALPKILAEISGHVMLSDSVIAAIQDEKGTLYLIDARTGDVVSEHIFAGKGDYEDVALTPEGLYVLRSDGTLFYLSTWAAPRLEAPKIETDLSSKCDAEGLEYDPTDNHLLIACKDQPGAGLKGVRAVYAFSLTSQRLDPSPRYMISIEKVASAMLHVAADAPTAVLVETLNLEEFKPSALAFHPLNDQLYVVSSSPPAIAVLARDGSLLGAERLPEELLPQPEGIAFLPNGDMILSTEAGSGMPGRLVFYRYLQR